MTESLEISVAEVARRQALGEPLALIDVRELPEFQIARIADAELIPMGTVPAKIEQLKALAQDAPLVIFCHHGVRSLNVTVWLRQRGIENCFSMGGGIDRWTQEIDPAVPRY